MGNKLLVSHLMMAFLLNTFSTTEARCPKVCSCTLKMGRKTVICKKGGLNIIPTEDMDLNTHVIIITAPDDNPNNVTIGRIFLKFTNLEVVRITHSNVPAIGDSSFSPGRRIRVLDLSHNSIRFLRATDFNGLKNLQDLDLSYNQIAAPPSAPFRYLTSLTRLSLANNQLSALAPRFFYMLAHLDELDLSGNTLEEIYPENLRDVGGLRILKMSKCKLTKLHSVLYQQLPLLEELDLRDNLIASLAPEEFRHLTNLRMLLLDGNKLSVILEDTFHGHSLDELTMSRNEISELKPCAFCNASVTKLDLSHNKLELINDEVFDSLKQSLQVLNISFNSLTSGELFSVMKHLDELRMLMASHLQLEDIPSDAFLNNQKLMSLNLSHNIILGVSSDAIEPLDNLQDLDLSYNLIQILNDTVLDTISNMSLLRQLIISDNPYSCSDCGLEHFLLWLNSSGFYNDSCNDHGCLRCHHPEKLADRLLHAVGPEEMTSCVMPVASHRSLDYTSKAGLIIAVSVIVVLTVIIIAIIIVYRRHVAHYYTHEEERPARKSGYDKPGMTGKNGSYSDDKPSFMPAPERVDDNITVFSQPPNSVR